MDRIAGFVKRLSDGAEDRDAQAQDGAHHDSSAPMPMDNGRRMGPSS